MDQQVTQLQCGCVSLHSKTHPLFMALSCIPLSELASFAFSTIPICLNSLVYIENALLYIMISTVFTPSSSSG